MKSVSTSLLSLLAGLSLSLAVGCGDSGSSGGAGGNAGKGGSGIAGQSGRGGSTGTGGVVPASGGATGYIRCDASPDIGTTGGAGGRSGAGGSTAVPDAADVAWPDVPGTGGAGGSIDSGTGGRVDSGTGGSVDGSTDGSVDRSVDTQACINLGDIPTAYVQTADSSTRISSMWVVDGPCNASASMMQVNFYYWEKGYSCPRLSDRVTCQVEATSSAGATTVFNVDFVAVPLGGAMLHWQAEPSQITLSFPRLDGSAAGG
jgi:hypothetical protein